MQRPDEQHQERAFNRRLTLSFGTLVLLLMAAVGLASWHTFTSVMKEEEQRLTHTLAQLMGEAVSRISFSGKHHTRLLLTDLKQKNPLFTHLAVIGLDDTIIAHSDPSKNDTPMQWPPGINRQKILSSEGVTTLYRTLHRRQIREVFLPFHGGFNHKLQGIVHLAIDQQAHSAAMRTGLLSQLLLILVLTLLGVIVVRLLSRHYSLPVKRMAQRLRAILEHAPLLIAIHDQAHRTLLTSRLWRQWQGDLTGSLQRQLRPLDLHDPAHEETAQQQEVVLQADDQRYHYLASHFAIHTDPHIRLKESCLIALDISPRKEMERQLSESEERYRTVVTNQPGIVYRCAIDKEWTMDFISKGVERITGYPAEEFIQNRVRSFASIIHPEDAQMVEEQVMASVLTGEPYQLDYRMLDCEGAIRWVHEEGRANYAPNGQASWLNGVILDITDRKEMEATLARSQRYLQAAVDATQAGRFHYRVKEDSHECDQRTLEIFGLSNPSSINSYASWTQHIHPEDLAEAEQAFHQALRSTSTNTYDIIYRIMRPSGQLRHLRSQAWIERTRHGQAKMISGLIFDITAQKELELTLSLAREQAEEASRAKSDFLASMSHEIRTPMNTVIGMAEVLLETPIDADQRHYLETLQHAGESLLDLINAILDLSKIESGKFEPLQENFNLHQLVEETCGVLEVQAAKRALTLELIIRPGTPRQVIGDPARIRQILINLIGNGIKFTKQGKVEVTLHLERTGSTAELMFSIEDSGLGIAPELQEKIFEKFSQLDSGMSRRHEGSGLGLTICKHLVDLLGGRIWLKSRPGEGSHFYFTTPYQPGEASSQPTHPAATTERAQEQPQSARILLVEDSADNRMLIQTYLKKSPHILEIACDGQEAIDKSLHGGPFDLILMDMQMPVVDGYTATRTIRQREQQTQQLTTPIIALTAHALRDDAQRSLEAGCDAHLTKPIKKQTLLDAIARYRKP
uniref:Sensory/regulatory protein RpfC n=1 Tax=Magnetococcus massalia (strain MO-1) TaxID=451514 RepID=A0A1S7LIX6_MAGMO|nr:putative response regulator receiver modulated histidine kinase with PAS domain [Candidatus Magnetococcus massalia]